MPNYYWWAEGRRKEVELLLGGWHNKYKVYLIVNGRILKVALKSNQISLEHLLNKKEMHKTGFKTQLFIVNWTVFIHSYC